MRLDSSPRLQEKSDIPKNTLNRDVPVLNGKTLSYETLLNVIGRRFHSCLQTEAKREPDLANTMSDGDLIHKVCRRERLTLYNFLKEHNSDGILHTEEGLKDQINKEYALYFPRKEDLNG